MTPTNGHNWSLILWSRSRVIVCLLSLVISGTVAEAQALSSERGQSNPLARHYKIAIDVDYHAASFTGREVVRVANSGRDEIDSVSFHLYPNVGLGEESELWLTVQRVLIGTRELRFSLKSHGSVVRVQLPTKLPSKQSIELTLEFTGRVPKVQREETSLLAHFLHEVNDAVNDEPQSSDARDIFFASDQATLLGYFYPMLAIKSGLSTEQGLATGVGGVVLSEVADYDVTVRVDEGVTVIASAPGNGHQLAALPGAAARTRTEYVFHGEQLRGFALTLGEKLQAVEKQVGKIRIASWYQEGDQGIGKRMLESAARAVEVYNKAFGEYPSPTLNVIELPLTAGYSGIEFPGMVVLAQAYYIDFNTAEAQRLPQLLREQADVIEAALEFTLAHSLAHQWWGCVVGSDPQRNPWLDEALANYSAAYFYEAAYGKALGAEAIDRQLRATWHAWRMLGGMDQEVDKPAREFHSSIQFAAIVQSKGALMLAALRQELGDDRFFSALRYYYNNHKFQIATPDHLRYALLAAVEDPQAVKDLLQRWLKEKHADEDIGVAELTMSNPPGSKKRTLGRFFGRIGRAAARPF